MAPKSGVDNSILLDLAKSTDTESVLGDQQFKKILLALIQGLVQKADMNERQIVDVHDSLSQELKRIKNYQTKITIIGGTIIIVIQVFLVMLDIGVLHFGWQ